MPNSFQQSHKCNPVKDILRMASLNCVKGKPYLQMACTQLGKTVIGKKVPAINICGNANKLISKGIDVSLFATLLKINHPSAGYGNLSSIFILEGDNIVNVSWALQQKLRWYMPWEKFAAMVKEKSWIAGMDTSLNKLKTLCEK